MDISMGEGSWPLRCSAEDCGEFPIPGSAVTEGWVGSACVPLTWLSCRLVSEAARGPCARDRSSREKCYGEISSGSVSTPGGARRA